MDRHIELLKDLLIDKTLNDIEFFDIDLVYASPDIKRFWVIDGGVQLQLDDTYFSFALSYEDEFFNVFPKKIGELNKEINFQALGARDVPGLNYLIGSKIINVETKWNFYFDIDENLEPIGEKKFIPIEIVIHFSNLSLLQIAAVAYEIEDDKLVNLRYNSESELLISFNKEIEILNEE